MEPDPGEAEPYVKRILYHDHVSVWRRRRLRPEALYAAVPEPASRAGDAGADDATLRLLLRDALLALPPRQRAVLVLRYLDDLSTEETARLLGRQAGTVASQASRALARLRATVPGLMEAVIRTQATTGPPTTAPPATARGDDGRAGGDRRKRRVRRGEGGTAMSQHRSRSDHDVLDRLVGSAVRDLAAHVRPAQLAPGAIAAGFRLRRRMRVRRAAGVALIAVALIAAIAVPSVLLRRPSGPPGGCYRPRHRPLRPPIRRARRPRRVRSGSPTGGS